MTSIDSQPRQIIHLDMDAFYAAVEVLDNPHLAGQAVIVGGAGHRGVVSAASYEARKFGVHSAQPIITARRLCPQAVFLPVRMSRYKQVSEMIFEIFRRFTPLVEPLSLDEAFLDMTGSTRLFGDPTQVAIEIKRLVKTEIGLTVSAGVGPNKLVAKIASDFNKPDGLTIVPLERVRDFLDPLPISRLWGVGRATQKALSLLGVETIGDLSRLPPELLPRKFGVLGRQLVQLAAGIDDRRVEAEREVKSIGAEETFIEDIIDSALAERELLRLSVRVARRLRRHGFMARTVNLKVKYHDFQSITRADTLPEPTDQARQVYQIARKLLKATAVGERPVRLLGLSLSSLVDPEERKQISLFDDANDVAKQRRLEQALDRITEKYGNEAIAPATLYEK